MNLSTIPNSRVLLVDRAYIRQFTWRGPLAMLLVRPLLLLLAQGCAALLTPGETLAASWTASAKWWSVYGTVADVGCLLILRRLLPTEKIRLRDLVGFSLPSMWRHILVGCACFIVGFPLLVVGFSLAIEKPLFGSLQAVLFPGAFMDRVLPLWAILFSFIVWWPVAAIAEELTFLGYALPRLEVLFAPRWKALTCVLVFWTVEQCCFPFIPDLRYVLYRSILLLPILFFTTHLYLRVRRLTPFIVAHALTNLVAMFWTLSLGNG